MSIAYQKLYEKALEISDEDDRYYFYVNHSIDYLRDRIEDMVINAGDLEETKDLVHQIEHALDKVQGMGSLN